jgi:hypothetical protein
MSIKSNLEKAYSSLPIKVQEFLAPKSNIYQIEQGQKYSKAKFANPATGEDLNYSQMLELYENSNSTVRERYVSITIPFDSFAEPYITTINHLEQHPPQFEKGSTEALLHVRGQMRTALAEYGIDLNNPEELQIQDPLDNSPYDQDIFHN